MNRFIQIALVLALIAPVSLRAWASEPLSIELSEGPPLINEQKAFEMPIIEVMFNSSGAVVQILGAACEGCAKERYLPARGIQFFHGRDHIAPDVIANHSDGGGTILIDIRSRMVDEVRFFMQREDDDHEI